MERKRTKLYKWSKFKRLSCPFITAFIGVLLGYYVISALINVVLIPKTCNVVPLIEVKRKIDIKLMDHSNRKEKQIFVGVITAKKYLRTRAKAAHDSWGRNFPGSIAFFSSENSKIDDDKFPLVNLKGVDDVYPPQKKTFLMFKYMHDHFINDFEFFMKADDDAYVREDKLSEFLNSVRSSELYFIGQPGRGVKKDVGHLGLDKEEFFCMGGSGYILSRALLQTIAPHITECINDCRTGHEDVEMWRCVKKHAGVSCTAAKELSDVFYHSLKKNDAFAGPLHPSDIGQVVTLHPLKNHLLQYKMNYLVESVRIREKEHAIVNATREINFFQNEFNLSVQSLDDPLSGVFFNALENPQKLNYQAEFDDQEWERAEDETHYQLNKEKTSNTLHPAIYAVNEDIITTLTNSVARFFRVRINEDFRLQRGVGLEFKFELIVLQAKPISRNSRVPIKSKYIKRKVRRKQKVNMKVMAYVKIPFGMLVVRTATDEKLDSSSLQMPNERKVNSKSERIHIILPFTEKEQFEKFIKNYQLEVLEEEENVRLLVMLSSVLTDAATEIYVKNLASVLNSKFQNSKIEIIVIANTHIKKYLLPTALKLCEDKDLIFFTEPDVYITSELLDRIRLFSVRGKQVYFPIAFTEHHPMSYQVLGLNKPRPFNLFIDDQSGYWNKEGKSSFAIYKSDLELSVTAEQYDLEIPILDIIINAKSLTIVRAPDPGLIQNYQWSPCSENPLKKDYNTCLSMAFEGFSSVIPLGRFVIEHPEILGDSFRPLPVNHNFRKVFQTGRRTKKFP